MIRKPTVIKHMDRPELEKAFRVEKDPRVKERLLAILHLYDGRSTVETASMVKRSIPSVKRWLKAWNQGGHRGLLPHFTGGPRPRMGADEWKKLVDEIEGKGYDIKDVRVYIRDAKGIEYSYGAVWKWLRRKLGVRYGKAYPKNKRRPANAEGILKKGTTKR